MLPTESPNLWLPLVYKGNDQEFLNFFAINNDLSVDLLLVLQLFMTEISPVDRASR